MAEKNSGHQLPPVHFWGYDPVFTQYTRLFLTQALLIAESSELPGTYILYGHPLVKVNIMGYVVSFVEKEKYFKFEVDDGTGVLPVHWWKTTDDIYSSDTTIELGDLINVHGRLTTFKVQREVKADSISKEQDQNAEILHWLDVMRLSEGYKKPFVPPKNVKGTEVELSSVDKT